MKRKGQRMKKKKTEGKSSLKRQPWYYWAGAAGLLLLTLGPFLWAFIVSITPEYEMFTNTEHMLPETVVWSNYQNLFSMTTSHSVRLFRGLKNSLTAAAVTLAVGVPLSLITAYTLTKLEFPGRRWFKNSLLITMVIPVFATIIPLFRIFVEQDLLDNQFWLSLVYVSSFLPMSTWLMSNYFATIPREILDAARVDGCGPIETFLRIVLPVSSPVILACALIMFLSAWNQFQIPLILASSLETKPVSIVTSEFMTKDSIQYGLTAAGGLIAIIPPAILALLFRKFLVNGMMGGASKE